MLNERRCSKRKSQSKYNGDEMWSILLPLPFVGLVPLGLHFFEICLFCSQLASLLGFNLSFLVIRLWALQSPHVPFSYRQAEKI